MRIRSGSSSGNKVPAIEGHLSSITVFLKSTNNIYSLWLAKDSVLGDDMMMMDSDIVFDKQIITKLLNSGL